MYTTQADIERKKFSKCNLNTAYLKLLTLRAVQLLLRLVMRLTFFVKFVRDVRHCTFVLKCVVSIAITFGPGNFDLFYSFESNKVTFSKYLQLGIESLKNIDGISC